MPTTTTVTMNAVSFMDSSAQMPPSGFDEGFASMSGATPSQMGDATAMDILGNNSNFRANSGAANAFVVIPRSGKAEEINKHELFFTRRTKLGQYEFTRTYFGFTLSGLNAYLRYAKPGQYNSVVDVNRVFKFAGVIDNAQPRNSSRSQSQQVDVNCVMRSQVMCFNYWQDQSFAYLPSESERFITCRDKGNHLWLVLMQVTPDVSDLYTGDDDDGNASATKRVRPITGVARDAMDEKYDLPQSHTGGGYSAEELQADRRAEAVFPEVEPHDYAMDALNGKRTAGDRDEELGTRPYWQFVPVCTASSEPPTFTEVYGRNAQETETSHRMFDCLYVGRSNFIYGANEHVQGTVHKLTHPLRPENILPHLSEFNKLLIVLH